MYYVYRDVNEGDYNLKIVVKMFLNLIDLQLKRI